MPFQPTGMQQQPAFNPFRQSMMMPQQTGFMQPQQTGFMQPQQTGFNPFQQQNQSPQQQQPFQQPQQSGAGGFLQPQSTGMMAFGTGSVSGRGGALPTLQQQPNFAQPQPQPLMPQSTGSNPFRQSLFINPSMNPSGALSQPTSPFQSIGGNAGGFGTNTIGQFGGGNNAFGGNANAGASVQRPGSTPALSNAGTQPLVPQATGSKNPFAPPGGIPQKAPEVPKGPSMNELAWQKTGQVGQGQFGGFGGGLGAGANGSGPASTSPWASGGVNGAPNGSGSGGANAAGEGISSIASSFIDFSKPPSPSVNGGTTDFLSQFGSLSVNTGTSSPSPFGSLSSNPTGAASLSPTKTGASAGSGGFLQPQQTGYGGSTVKRFQPTSSFGSQLLENLPPISEPGAGGSGTPGGGATSPSPFGGAGGAGGLPSQGTGSSFAQPGQTGQQGQQQGLSAQMTGTPNPFRQSMFGGGLGGLSQQPTGAFGGAAGAGAGAGAFGAGSPFAGQNRMAFGGPNQQQQQQQQQSSPFGGYGQQGGQQGSLI